MEGVALAQQCHSCRPQGLVEHQGDGLLGDAPGQLPRNTQGAVGTDDKGAFFLVAVGPEHDQGQLHKTGNDGGYGSAGASQLRKAQIAEDQQRVEAQIDQHGYNTRRHGRYGLAVFPQSAGIALRQRKGNQADEHDVQVFLGVAQTGGDLLGSALALEIEHDELLIQKQKHGNAHSGQGRAEQEFVAECVAHAPVVAAAEKLGAEDARSGDSAEDAQVENEQQRVGNGDAGHLLRADPSDHNIVQHTHKLRDAVLDHDGDGDGQSHFIKCPVSDEFSP